MQVMVTFLPLLVVNSSVFCAAEDVRIEKLNVNSKAKSLRDDFVFMMISFVFLSNICDL
jgi:hypothetical protein